MTSKETIMKTIEHEKPDRVPLDVWFTPEIIDRLYERLENKVDINVPDFLTRKEYLAVLMGHDFITMEYGHVTGFYMSSDKEYMDEWGISWEWVDNNSGAKYTEISDHPLKHITDLSEFNMPDFSNPERFSRIKKCVDKYGGEYAIFGALTCTLFELSWFLRGVSGQTILQ